MIQATIRLLAKYRSDEGSDRRLVFKPKSQKPKRTDPAVDDPSIDSKVRRTTIGSSYKRAPGDVAARSIQLQF
jgi:hypothetical protein